MPRLTWQLTGQAARGQSFGPQVKALWQALCEQVGVFTPKSLPRPELRAALRALDRVLSHGHYSVPHYYGSAFLIGYRPGRFQLPATVPPYYDAHYWAMSTWWASPANR